MLRTLFLLLASALLILGAPAPMLWAVDYLVIDNDGATGGDGTLGNEFGTITEALNVAPLAAGDRIVLAAGSYDDTDETLPLNIPDGVSIIGAGAGTTTISGVTDPAHVLVFSGSGSAQTLSGVTVLPHSSFTAVRLSGSDIIFRAQSCVFSGGQRGIDRGTGLATVVATVSNCTFAAQAEDGIRDNTAAVGAASWNILNNVFSGTNSFYEAVSVAAVGSSDTLLDVVLSGNTGTGTFQVGVVVGGIIQGSGSFVADFSILNNSFTGATGANIFALMQALSSVDIEADMLISCNVAANAGVGIFFSELILGSANVNLERTVIGNSCYSNGVGFRAAQGAFNAANYTFSSDWSFNCARTNSSTGFFQRVAALTSAVVNLDVVYHGNVATANGGPGLLLSSSITASSITGTLNFGGGVFTKGLNAFNNNAIAMVVSVAGSTDTWNAEGNWWGTSTLSGVESTVFHQVDSGALVQLDFDPFLTSSMTLTPVGLATVGSVLRVNTTDGGFVPFAGKKPMVSTFNGNPINVNVAADGCSLTFIVPLLVPGSYALIVTNPGGQTGTVNIVVLAASGDSGGGCFVATASYGDEASAEVQTLRRWRDEHLAQNAIGRHLVKAYYAVSPPLAEAIADRPLARTVSRAALAPVVGAARLWMEAPWALFGLGLGAGWLLLRRKR